MEKSAIDPVTTMFHKKGIHMRELVPQSKCFPEECIIMDKRWMGVTIIMVEMGVATNNPYIYRPLLNYSRN